jgi:hypothetical protein
VGGGGEVLMSVGGLREGGGGAGEVECREARTQNAHRSMMSSTSSQRETTKVNTNKELE